jgi:hypothetical protein
MKLFSPKGLTYHATRGTFLTMNNAQDNLNGESKMKNLENNIAKNIIENMTADQKAEFINLSDEDRTTYATAFALDIIKKRGAMAVELLLNSAKMEKFAQVVATV